MASKRRLRRVAARVCARKAAYETQGDAEWVARLRRERSDEAGLADVVAYPCKYCGRWHLGHEHQPRKTSYEQRGQQRVPVAYEV